MSMGHTYELTHIGVAVQGDSEMPQKHIDQAISVIDEAIRSAVEEALRYLPREVSVRIDGDPGTCGER
jgi:hypothetical protein